MRLRTLGQCVIEVGETRLGPDAELLFALALYLAAEGGRRVSRASLTALLWPEAEEVRGAHSLRQAVYRLRAFGGAIGSDRSHVWLDPSHVEADFARVLDASPVAEPDEIAATIGGPFLPAYAPTFSASFAEWVDRERDIVNAGVRRVLIAAIGTRRTQGDWGTVAALAARCLGVDPLNEEATLASAEAAALQGGKAHALSILDRYLKDIGPGAREIRIPATVLRRRIAEAPQFERPAPVGEAPFVGRAAEMAELNRALQLAHAGQGSAHLIWGEPGIGKTRLVHEFSRGALFQHVRVVRVGCQSSDERRPLSVFVDLVPKLMALPGALGCAPESMRYLRRMVEHTGPDSLPSPDTREAAVLAASIRRSLFDILDAIAGESCLVLLLEDVHWLDAMSWQVMAELVPWLATRRLLLVLTGRTPDPERQLATPSGLHRRQLGPLPDAASRALVDALVASSGRALGADLAAWCLANGGGNPYYLCELALHGLRTPGRYEVPTSLTTLITERLTRLRPTSLRVLQACAILGKHSTLQRLEAVLEQRRVDLLDSLDELETHGLVASDGARINARHELLSQAALSQLSVLSRRLLHRHAALLLERTIDEPQSAAMLWECAEHWQRAGEVARALQFLRSCARHAIEMGMPAEAAKLLERALTLPQDDVEREAVLHELALALRLSGQWERVLPILDEVSQLQCRLAPLGCTHTDVEIMSFEARWRAGVGIRSVFEDLCGCVQTITAGPEHRIKAATLALMLADNLCERERAQTIFGCLRPYLDVSAVDRSVCDHLELVYHTSFGEPKAAAAAARRLVGSARERGDTISLIQSLQSAVRAFRCVGSLPDAEAAASEAFALAEKQHLGSAASSAANSFANLLLAIDDLPGARHWNLLARQWALATQDQLAIGNYYETDARLALSEGYHDEAERLLHESLVASRSNIHPRLESRSLALQILIALDRDGHPPSEAQLLKLLDLHQRTRHVLGHDTVVVALYRALLSLSRSAEGVRLVDEYVSIYRRDGLPIGNALSQVIASCQAAAGS